MLNLTPHPIVIITDQGETEIPASGMVARVKQQERTAICSIGTDVPGSVMIPVFPAPRFTDITWPEFDKTKYSSVIVSLLVGQGVEALPVDEKPEFIVFSPDTSPESVVRAEDGSIEVVRALNVHSFGRNQPSV